MMGKAEEATTATLPSQTRQENMEAFCLKLLEEVRAGKVKQLLAIVESSPARRAPLLYLNCEEEQPAAHEFVEDVCACVSHVIDMKCVPPGADSAYPESRRLH